MNKIPDIDWARLAAYIDSEGCITIHYVPTRNTAGGPYPLFSVVIVNCEEKLHTWLQSTFGVGALLAIKRRSDKHRQCYRWTAVTKQAEWLLRGCLPYFIIKAEQAKVALEFRDTIRQAGGKQPSEEIWQRRRFLVDRLHDLNRKGPKVI